MPSWKKREQGLLDEFRAVRQGHVTPLATPPVQEAPTRRTLRPEASVDPYFGESTDAFDLPSWAWYLSVAVLTLGTWVTVGIGYPVLGHSWRGLVALSGTALVGVGGAWLWSHRYSPSARGLLTSGLGAMVLTFLFCVGAIHSVVLGGKVYPATSKTAEVYTTSHQFVTYFDQLVHADNLLRYSTSKAQAHYNDYPGAITQIQNIVTIFGNLDLGSLPDSRMLPVVNDLREAANFGALGLAAKYQLLQVTTDATLSSEVVSDEATMYAQTTAAWYALTQVGNDYGFSMAGQVH